MKANLHRFNFMYHRILLQILELEKEKIITEENLKDKNLLLILILSHLIHLLSKPKDVS